MTPEQFCYWLQGYTETRESPYSPTKREWDIIQDHLKLVFDKRTPNYPPITLFDPSKGIPTVTC